MAVKIKLMRMGKIRAPYYRIIVADARTKRDGRAIEEIGKYHPTREPSLIEVDSERAQYWLSVGAQPTEPVAAILKVTGDWQKFKGEPGAEGTLRQPEAKADKKSLFEAAAKDSTGEGKTGATTPRKRAAKKATETVAEEPKTEAAAAATEAATPDASTTEAAEAAPAATVTEQPKTEDAAGAAEGAEAADTESGEAPKDEA